MRSALRARVIEIAGRLVALRAESVPLGAAVELLTKQGVLTAPGTSAADQPVSAALLASLPASAAPIADYVRAGEQHGQGEPALRLLSELSGASRKRRDGWLSIMVIEFLLLLLVLSIYAIFVLPQMRAMFDIAGEQLPLLTRIVFSTVTLASPLTSLALLLFVVVLLWRTLPIVFGPLIGPLDRLVLALPALGPVMRRQNSESLSGWLGFAADDDAARRVALNAAKAWDSGPLSRVCKRALADTERGSALNTVLATSTALDREFRAALAMPDQGDASKTLRARWQACARPPDAGGGTLAALTHVVLGILIALLVIAMYLPIFKLSAML